jgi:PEP-CTERM motif
MNNNKSMMIGMAAATLLGASQVHAANGPTVAYSGGDVLIDFRDLTTPGVDLTVDVGNINSFAAVVGEEEVVSPTALNNTLGAFGGGNDGDNIGFTAAAYDSSGTLYLTRTTSGAGVQGTPSPQAANNAATGNLITSIGVGAQSSGIGKGVSTTGFLPIDVNGISKTTAANAGSYDYFADNGGGSTVINFGGTQTLGTAPIESTANDGGGSLTAAGSYASLWEIPALSTGLSDTYLGYFTFQSDGELDYTGVNAVVAVPEPSTYGLLAATGLLALALRRQFRSLLA